MFNYVLKWTPIFDAIIERTKAHDAPSLIIAPFIKRESLVRILDTIPQVKGIKVISRWNLKDVATGVSDISVYPYLSKLGIPLYIHNRIHLKLFVFESNLGFHTSGNITSYGLGTVPQSNIEIGCFVSLSENDWVQLFKLLDESRIVDDSVYSLYSEFLKINKEEKKEYPPLKMPADWNKDYSIMSLPACESPELLYDFSIKKDTNWQDPEFVRKCLHDLILYGFPRGQNKDAFFDLLSRSFRSQAFIKDLVSFIKEIGSVRFGAVNDWIRKKCTDVPLPYRWELKANTRILYNWLAAFYHQISWKIPGKRSQVIYWKD